MSRQIAVSAIEEAINRARAAQPASGVEASLAPEVAILAGLYGRLIWSHCDSLDADSLSDRERLALQLWLPGEAAARTPRP